jgi:hypothetical protein
MAAENLNPDGLADLILNAYSDIIDDYDAS